MEENREDCAKVSDFLVLVERVYNNDQALKQHQENTTKFYEKFENKLDGIFTKLLDLDVKVGIQNGRVTKLELNKEIDHLALTKLTLSHEHEPSVGVLKELNEYKKDMKPLHTFSTNWKPILLLVIGAAIVINYIPPLLNWMWTTVSGLFEIGL